MNSHIINFLKIKLWVKPSRKLFRSNLNISNDNKLNALPVLHLIHQSIRKERAYFDTKSVKEI